MIHNYWCHSCSTNIRSSNEIEACFMCNSEFIEEVIQEDEHPSTVDIQNENGLNSRQSSFRNVTQSINFGSGPDIAQAMNMHSFGFGDFNDDFFGSIGFSAPLSQMPSTSAFRIDFPSNGPQNMQSMQFINIEDLLRARRGPEGAPPATSEDLQHIKTVEVEGEQCSICQEEQCGVARQLPCGHSFHWDCLKPWLQMHNTCPTCRKPLAEAASNSN